MKTEQKITLNSGSSARSVTYDRMDTEDRKRAHLEFFGLTSDGYDEIKKRNEEARYPLIKNLRCHGGHIYYLDEDGNKILDVLKHMEKLDKKHYGEE
jgi:hypothetical protein